MVVDEIDRLEFRVRIIFFPGGRHLNGFISVLELIGTGPTLSFFNPVDFCTTIRSVELYASG